MRYATLILILSTVFTVGVPASILAQSGQSDWQSVQALPADTALVIETKNSQTFRGYLVNVSPTNLSLNLDGGTQTTIETIDVRRVFLGKKASRGRAIKIGAAIGAAVGLGLTLAVLSKSNSSDDAPTYGVVFPILGAGAGAAAGVAAGKGKIRKGNKIYESK